MEKQCALAKNGTSLPTSIRKKEDTMRKPHQPTRKKREDAMVASKHWGGEIGKSFRSVWKGGESIRGGREGEGLWRSNAEKKGDRSSPPRRKGGKTSARRGKGRVPNERGKPRSPMRSCLRERDRTRRQAPSCFERKKKTSMGVGTITAAGEEGGG